MTVMIRIIERRKIIIITLIIIVDIIIIIITVLIMIIIVIIILSLLSWLPFDKCFEYLRVTNHTGRGTGFLSRPTIDIYGLCCAEPPSPCSTFLAPAVREAGRISDKLQGVKYEGKYVLCREYIFEESLLYMRPCYVAVAPLPRPRPGWQASFIYMRQDAA